MKDIHLESKDRREQFGGGSQRALEHMPWALFHSIHNGEPYNFFLLKYSCFTVLC